VTDAILQTTFLASNTNPHPRPGYAEMALGRPSLCSFSADALLLARTGLSDADLCATKICNWAAFAAKPPSSAIPTHIAWLPLVSDTAQADCQCWLCI